MSFCDPTIYAFSLLSLKNYATFRNPRFHTQEISGFLLGQSWPPLPRPATPIPTDDDEDHNDGGGRRNGSGFSESSAERVEADAAAAVAAETSASASSDGWCRRWYILSRGNLMAFSGWGGGHSCVGRMVLKGSTVEDAPEKASDGAPFAFRVRAAYW